MKHFFVLALLLTPALAFSQSAYVGSSLNSLLDNPDGKFHKVDIVLAGKVEPFELKKQFNLNKTPIAQRQKQIIHDLMAAADAAQVPFITDLEITYQGMYKDLNRLWICNMITLEANIELLQELVKRGDIEFIDLSSARMMKPLDPIKRGEGSILRAPNGIEPGLEAINAPALWAMGYTGRGRLGHSVDTGVWPDHPAISNNWLGNYRPLDECWYAYDTQFPGDKSGSHGTHTIGTTMGLDRATNDTIGVAFNARFIASDPVATSINTVIPLIEFLPAFQFALNPDGDTSTVGDIPDAINNSWGFVVVDDTTLCTGYFADMLTTIEAAGIANVASAGNDGPGDSTMSYPFHINTGVVNSFTVGAVNHYYDSLPIASFSSRGPTTCWGDSIQIIKPEVVAPGVNVRSAVVNGGYDSYQGTSMAGPHATGAVLLLKEAFPYLTGEEILLALYYTAIDLGPVGEDNSYGRGMIDVLAAFNYLAQSHTPVPPHTSPFDIAITEIQDPNFSYTCDDNITPTIKLENLGDSTITDATIYYGLVGTNTNTYNWTGTLQAGQSTTIILPNLTMPQSSNYELMVNVEPVANITELDSINNTRIARFNYRGVESIPFIEQFEAVNLGHSHWYINNPNFNFTWDTISTLGVDGGQTSMYMRFFSQVPHNQIDEIVTPRITTPNGGPLWLKFNYAYQHRHNVLSDTVGIDISNDCGQNWSRVFFAGGEDLNTVVDEDKVQGFLPSLPQHWNDTIIDIAQFADGSDILVKFVGKNRRGNSLVIDNVKIYSGAEPISVIEIEKSELKVYPNPFSDRLTIEYAEPNERMVQLNVYDVVGKEILHESFRASQGKKIISMAESDSGVYFVRWCTEAGCENIKVVRK